MDRTTKDVNLFTELDPEEAVRVCSALRQALSAEGFGIQPAPRPTHENRFIAVDPVCDAAVQVEVFPDGGRLRRPVQLDVGPVLHRDDLAADKTLAMWGRGEPRDYVDVVALLEQYSPEQLLQLAAEKDRGFTPATFVVSLRAIRRLAARDWSEARIDSIRSAAVRSAIERWLAELEARE